MSLNWQPQTRDNGASRAEWLDTRYTRNERKQKLTTWAYLVAAIGTAAILGGLERNIALVIVGGLCFGVAAVLGWMAS